MRLQQAKALKEQVDATRQKEVVFKSHVQPWIDEAFLITVAIKGKLTQMKVLHALKQGFAQDIEYSALRIEQI